MENQPNPATPPAPAPNPAPAPAPAPNPAPAPTSWTDGFNDEMKGWVQNKGFKDPAALADSYRNFEKLQGVPQDRLLKLPENMNSPEGRAILEKLGAPKDAKGYNLEVPQGADPTTSQWAAETFAKLGMPKDMAEGFVKEWNAKNAAIVTESKAQAQAAQQTAEANLKTKWGMAYDQNRAKVEDAARVLGITPDQAGALGRALGPEGAPELLLKLSGALQESSFVTGQPAASAMQTPEQARALIDDLRRDQEFMSRVGRGDHEAKQKWNRAHEMAYPGSMTI